MKLREEDSKKFKYDLVIKIKVGYDDEDYVEYVKDQGTSSDDIDVQNAEIAKTAQKVFDKQGLDLTVEGNAEIDYVPGSDHGEVDIVITSDHELTDDEKKKLLNPEFYYVDNIIKEYPDEEELRDYEKKNDTYISDTHYTDITDDEDADGTYTIKKLS